ncbi:MAG: DNA-methyltransferase [Candidatus Odinarchaeota archaeon]
MIKPYYEDKWGAIYLGDCREILPHLDVKVDLVLTDPPYGIALDLAWLSELHLAHSKPANKIDVPIVGDTGMSLGFLFEYPRWVVFGFPYVFNTKATGWLVWDKQPGIDTDRTLTSPVEMASTTLWKGFRIVRCMWAGYMRDNGEYRFTHPTQKPQKVINYLINKSEGLILDPFLGSGTTAVCAKKLNRHYIGIEIEERYCEIAAKRLCQEVFDLT